MLGALLMKNRNELLLPALAVAILAFFAGASFAERTTAAPASGLAPSLKDAGMQMQGLVMDIADDHIAALGESVYLITRNGALDSKGRWLAQSFLRNGVGACLDIAVGPNPPVSLLDLLVLTSLQVWSFEKHWIPAGIGNAGKAALDRLEQAEVHAWATAQGVLSEDQMHTLRELIGAWIAENPNRTVVALVRFDEFKDSRRISSLAMHEKARGLLREVGEVSAAVDDARLLGERLLWFAGRYPYLVGEQTELTAYRLLDQPEGAQLIAALESLKQLSDAFTARLGTLDGDLAAREKAFFSQVATERAEAIDQLFDRLRAERKALLEDILSRQEEVIGTMTALRETILASGALAKELTGTVEAVDRVVSRFDAEPESEREPLDMADVRDAAIEAGRAADRMTVLLERVDRTLESSAWDRRIDQLTEPATALLNRAFLFGVILVCMLIGGLFLLRVVPHRNIENHVVGKES